MNPTMKVEVDAFNKVMRQWLANTSRELPKAINSRMFYILLRAYVVMVPRNPQELRNKIHDYMRHPIGERRFDKRTGKRVGEKSGRVFRRQHLIAQARAKKEGKKGLYGDEMRRASGAVFRRAVGSVGYLKSALVGAMKRLSPGFVQWGYKEKKGKKPKPSVPPNSALAKIAMDYPGVGASNVGKMKGAKQTVYLSVVDRMVCSVLFSIGVKDGQEGRVQAIYEEAFTRAFRDERVELESHIAARVEQAAEQAVKIAA